MKTINTIGNIISQELERWELPVYHTVGGNIVTTTSNYFKVRGVGDDVWLMKNGGPH